MKQGQNLIPPKLVNLWYTSYKELLDLQIVPLLCSHKLIIGVAPIRQLRMYNRNSKVQDSMKGGKEGRSPNVVKVISI